MKKGLVDKGEREGYTRYGDRVSDVNRHKGSMSGSKAEVMGHASPVYSVDTMAEQYDLPRVQVDKSGPLGQPMQAWDYKY